MRILRELKKTRRCRCIWMMILFVSLFILYFRSCMDTMLVQAGRYQMLRLFQNGGQDGFASVDAAGRSASSYSFDKSEARHHHHRGHRNRIDTDGPGSTPLGAKLILLTSYKRSGSTFLGAMLGWHEDSFYWIEPLWGRYESQYIQAEGVVCHYKRPDCEMRPHGMFKKKLQVVLHGIQDIYNCTFSERYGWMNPMSQINLSKTYVGPSWKEFRLCIARSKINCLRALVPKCMSSKYRVIKILRMDLRLSSQLLVTMPGLKLIHLFRDPRGQLNSHIHTRWYGLNESNIKDVEDDVLALCERMRKDLTTARRLLEEFPDRFRIVQYEDFDNLMDKSRKLYEFVGMEFDDKAETLVTQLRPKRGKAGFHPFSYRDNLRWQSVKLVNEHCSDLYKELQYNIFKTETDLRNHSIPALSGPLPFSL